MEKNENENTTDQNLGDISKAILRRKIKECRPTERSKKNL